MPRRVRNPSSDERDLKTRADDARCAAQQMPEGPLREEALRKAAQLRSAGEIMNFLSPRRESASESSPANCVDIIAKTSAG